MGLTQKAAAELVHMSTTRFSELLNGKREPTFQAARAISKNLQISPSIVLGVS